MPGVVRTELTHMVERSIALILLVLGGGLIFYGTRLMQLSGGGEGLRLFSAAAMLGIAMIVMGAIIDSDRRRHERMLEVIPPPQDALKDQG